jgi:hypothetical protein
MRKEEGSGSTNSARAYAAKKMKSFGPLLASDATLCFSLGVRPGAYHPISHHRLARQPVVLNREGGSSVAMVVDGGRGLRRNQEAQKNKRQRRWVRDDRRMEVRICMADSTPCLSSPTSGSPSGVALGAHTARSTYPGIDKWAHVPPFSQHRSAKW